MPKNGKKTQVPKEFPYNSDATCQGAFFQAFQQKSSFEPNIHKNRCKWAKKSFQMHLYHFLKTQGQADILLRNLKLSFISESLNKYSVTSEMMKGYEHHLKTFNSDKTLGKYIQELLSNPCVEIIKITDIFNINQTI